MRCHTQASSGGRVLDGLAGQADPNVDRAAPGDVIGCARVAGLIYDIALTAHEPKYVAAVVEAEVACAEQELAGGDAGRTQREGMSQRFLELPSVEADGRVATVVKLDILVVRDSINNEDWC